MKPRPLDRRARLALLQTALAAGFTAAAAWLTGYEHGGRLARGAARPAGPAGEPDDLLDVARAVGVTPEACPYLATDQLDRAGEDGGPELRYCGLPADHDPEQGHPSLIERTPA